MTPNKTNFFNLLTLNRYNFTLTLNRHNFTLTVNRYNLTLTLNKYSNLEQVQPYTECTGTTLQRLSHCKIRKITF